MSVKNNGIALAAAAAVGVTLGALGPVVESLLNDAVVSDAKIVAFDKAGEGDHGTWMDSHGRWHEELTGRRSYAVLELP